MDVNLRSKGEIFPSLNLHLSVPVLTKVFRVVHQRATQRAYRPMEPKEPFEQLNTVTVLKEPSTETRRTTAAVETITSPNKALTGPTIDKSMTNENENEVVEEYQLCRDHTNLIQVGLEFVGGPLDIGVRKRELIQGTAWRKDESNSRYYRLQRCYYDSASLLYSTTGSWTQSFQLLENKRLEHALGIGQFRKVVKKALAQYSEYAKGQKDQGLDIEPRELLKFM